ncbi:MAG: hypothetical protein ACTSPN_16415 [Promethearchaeota archaeon]
MMKTNNKVKSGLIICFLSLSIIGFAVPTVAYNRGAWMQKDGEYQFLSLWIPGWVLELVIYAQRTYDDDCGHYYFSSHSEGYTESSFFFP